MQRTEKERVVTELAEQLRSTESLIVADYRGLTNSQLQELRAKLRGSGARFQVVKNTLTRRAVEEVGSEALLALLEGPTAIAFVETDGDPVAVAKALSDTARDTKVLTLRGGLLAGTTIDADAIEALAKLPTPDVIKSQLVGVIVAPLTGLVSLLAAPVRDLVGLIDARIAQLEEGADASVADAPVADAPVAEAQPEPEAEAAEATADAEAAAEQPQAIVEPGAAADESAESTDESEPAGEPPDTESEE
jgi:large subunit ribosomal protein L10